MPLPQNLLDYDITNASVTVWLFKKSGGTGGTVPNYNGRWITTTDALDTALRTAMQTQRDQIEETIPFSLLAQNNEASALAIDTLETHAPIVAEKTHAPLQDKAVRSLQQIQNTSFYVIRLVHNNIPLLGVRKTDTTWQSKKRRMKIDVVFDNEGLTLDEQPAFSLSQYLDFFIFGEQIFVLNKSNFESVLHYKAAHEEDFAALRSQDEFAALFSDMTAIQTYVGTNKIHLRRASAIRQKGHYLDEEFMQRLRAGFARVGLNIEFDNNGRIVPTIDTCPDIFQALLDHRLTSSFSETNYDVQDATPII
ncbi:DUF4868 domain-containing protein [Altererythrobacter sp. RZ02]|uniref:DUF4868 domain-containing protein n=1 Tax=Pontixanthobacter rizhaonensis TaxID=2730337 RepID=A0A848QMD9_9SPHN|nr:Kiwa anti-phage protein KwaB-like domain-containing protein [Pontixanthobacter rizhaonensis]NMW31787.1 DUF4868 domain-containing protein [Pontixanthobacter rizhaonensis]